MASDFANVILARVSNINSTPEVRFSENVRDKAKSILAVTASLDCDVDIATFSIRPSYFLFNEESVKLI